MTETECIHGLTPGTCSICRSAHHADASQASLNFSAIAEAVGDLSSNGDFRTKDVAAHPAVQKSHKQIRDDPAFNQLIGMYLTDSFGRLNIEQVSPKGQSNAVWRQL